MALEDAELPKSYRNSKILYEQDLDAWRLATEDALATINLNLAQIGKDAVSSNYSYDNDGNNNLSQSLQEQINLLASGGSPITGTTSDTFTINSDSFSATLSTTGLTAVRTFTFPDGSSQIVTLAATQTLAAKTLTAPTIANFQNATHDHINATGGGVLDAAAISTGTFNVSRIPNLGTAQITSGTFADARIAASNVTQHQAALTILESQITDSTILARVGGNETITGSWTFPSQDPPAVNQATRQGMAKGWAYINGTTGAVITSYNVSGAVRNSTGNYTVSWNTDFSSADYVVHANLIRTGNLPYLTIVQSITAGDVNIITALNGTNADVHFFVVSYGTQ